MRFLKRHKFILAFVAILIFCSVMVVRQYIVNQWRHIDLREDLILLHYEGHFRSEEKIYQMLIQELPSLPDHSLIADEQRFKLLFISKKPPPQDLLWKYYVSVQNELRSRTNERVARAKKRAGTE